MALNQVNNGDSGTTARTTINTAISQIDTNTTDIATNAAAIATKQPLDADLTTIAGLTPSNDDTMQYIAGAWANRTVAQTKTTLALNNVDNTADVNKVVSGPQAAAIALKQTANAFDTTILNIQTAAADITITDNDNNAFYVITNSGVSLWNVPTSASIPLLPIGSVIELYNNSTSVGKVTITPAGGVTVNYSGTLNANINANYYARLVYIGTDLWVRTY